MDILTDNILIPAHILHVTVQGNSVVMNIKAGTYLILNETATYIWQILTERCTAQSVIELTAQRYKVDLRELYGDVEEFLLDCQRRQLIEIKKD